MKSGHILLLSLLTILLSCATPQEKKSVARESSHPMQFFVDIYRERLNHLSAVRAGECPMYPSCSEYSSRAFAKHGFVVGWMTTCDRLMRCGRDEMDLSPPVKINGRWKRYDPLKANTFWWDNNVQQSLEQ